MDEALGLVCLTQRIEPLQHRGALPCCLPPAGPSGVSWGPAIMMPVTVAPFGGHRDFRVGARGRPCSASSRKGHFRVKCDSPTIKLPPPRTHSHAHAPWRRDSRVQGGTPCVHSWRELEGCPLAGRGSLVNLKWGHGGGAGLLPVGGASLGSPLPDGRRKLVIATVVSASTITSMEGTIAGP